VVPEVVPRWFPVVPRARADTAPATSPVRLRAGTTGRVCDSPTYARDRGPGIAAPAEHPSKQAEPPHKAAKRTGSHVPCAPMLAHGGRRRGDRKPLPESDIPPPLKRLAGALEQMPPTSLREMQNSEILARKILRNFAPETLDPTTATCPGACTRSAWPCRTAYETWHTLLTHPSANALPFKEYGLPSTGLSGRRSRTGLPSCSPLY